MAMERRVRLSRGSWTIGLAAIVASAGVCQPLLAQDEPDPRIDENGRDVAIYPPDRLFDHHHMKLVLDIPDMSQPKFSATETITLSAIASPRKMVPLRAGEGLTFSSVTVDGQPAKYTHDKGKLNIELATPALPGQVHTIVMVYAADKPGGRGAGLTWSKDDPKTPEEDFMFHSQGQPESNHQWFACHDFPNLRLTTEIEVTVPKDYEALSNGHLVEVKKFSDGSGRTTFHWVQDKTHSYYLVSLIVSKFDVVNVGGKKSARPGLWMPVYGPLGSGDRIRETFGNTPEMIAYFEKLLDEPFPWDKYGQSIARDFAAGAMENTSATTFAPFAATARGTFLDGVISHELTHQWFGDLVAYKTWQHLWLGEGWATMGEALWAEHKAGSDGYQRAILGNMRRERGSGRGYYPKNSGMTSNRYNDPQERFMSADNVYSKGGFILHMLRQRLGDETFFKAVALYIDRFKYKAAETDDFRRVLEEVSGQSLERFFDQWVRRPGNPSVELDYTWDEATKTLKVVAEQTQRIDGDNPAYAFTLPLSIEMGDKEDWKSFYLSMDSKKVEGSIQLAHKPKSIEVDSNMTVLMRSKVRQELTQWIHQAEHGSTYYARAQAVDALAEFDDPAARDTLLKVASSFQDDEFLRDLAMQSVNVMDARATK